MVSSQSQNGERRTAWVWASVGVALIAALAAIASALVAYKTYSLQKSVVAKSERRSELRFQNPQGLEGGQCTVTANRGGIAVSGTATTINGEQIWLLIESPGIGRFYIPRQTPLSITDHHWHEFTKTIGGKKDSGQTFQLVAVAANLDASNILVRAYQHNAYVVGLPIGSYSIDQGCLIRS
jgi:hypothetical protein